MAVLRSRFAYIIVAVLRSTALRRVVEYTHGPHHTPFGEMSSSLHPGLNTVRPRPSDCGRCVCDPGVPVVCSTALIAAPLVRRAQKLEETGVPRGLDRPFHIIT